MCCPVRLAIVLVVLSLSASIQVVIVADEPPAASSQRGQQAGQQADSDAEQAAHPGTLVRQLDHPRFAEREAASQALESLGATAVDALARAAQRGTAEASRRAFAILEKFAHGGEDTARAAAQSALDEIAKGNRAAAAERARQILESARSDRQDPRYPLLDLLPQLPNADDVRIPRLLNPGRSSVTTVRINGTTRITAKENGRIVNIVEDPEDGITVEVTEPKQAGEADDAKPVTKKYAAKDAAELKAKHPEAHQLYEQYVLQPVPNRGLPGRLRDRLPEGLFPPGILDDELLPGFPEGFPDFDDDFFRRFEEQLPPELREFRKLRPQLPGRDPGDLRKELREHFRRLERELQQLREGPRQVPQPPAEEPPQPKPADEPEGRDGEKEQADKAETIEV